MGRRGELVVLLNVLFWFSMEEERYKHQDGRGDASLQPNNMKDLGHLTCGHLLLGEQYSITPTFQGFISCDMQPLIPAAEMFSTVPLRVLSCEAAQCCTALQEIN